jgi:hypothetical protein
MKLGFQDFFVLIFVKSLLNVDKDKDKDIFMNRSDPLCTLQIFVDF